MTQTKNFLTLSDNNSDMTQVTGLPFNADTISTKIRTIEDKTHPLDIALRKDLEDGRESPSSELIEVAANMVDELLPEGTDFQKGYLFGTMVEAIKVLADKIHRDDRTQGLTDALKELIEDLKEAKNQ